MYEKISKVKIGKENLPIKCDINVLSALQEEFGTLTRFEQKLIGLSPIIDKDGNYKYKPDGTLDYRMSEPSFKAIGFSLPIMILEGISQAEEQGEDYSDIDWRTPLKDADFNYIDIALAINEEFQRCFHRKKKTSSKGTTKAKVKKSTSTE